MMPGAASRQVACSFRVPFKFPLIPNPQLQPAACIMLRDNDFGRPQIKFRDFGQLHPQSLNVTSISDTNRSCLSRSTAAICFASTLGAVFSIARYCSASVAKCARSRRSKSIGAALLGIEQPIYRGSHEPDNYPRNQGEYDKPAASFAEGKPVRSIRFVKLCLEFIDTHPHAPRFPGTGRALHDALPYGRQSEKKRAASLFETRPFLSGSR